MLQMNVKATPGLCFFSWRAQMCRKHFNEGHCFQTQECIIVHEPKCEHTMRLTGQVNNLGLQS